MYKVKYHKNVIKFLQKQDRSIVKKIIDFFDEVKKDLNFIFVEDIYEILEKVLV